MKHEDFSSLEIEDVLPQVLSYCQEATKSSAVHWLSTYGLERVLKSEDHNWQWAITAADVIGKHMWSQPAADLFQTFQMWKLISQVYPDPAAPHLTPHLLQEPQLRFCYPVYFSGRLIGVLAFDRPKMFNPVQLVGAFQSGVDLAARYLHFAYQYMEAKNLSYLDELTGLYNQRYLPMALEHEIQRSRREKSNFTLLFLDIDFFKLVNDDRGHWVGSKLLVEIGHVLKTEVRTCDYCFRYGGDEFIVVLGGATLEDSRNVAERIRKAIEERTFSVEGHTLKLTVSIGLASYPQHAQTATQLIQLADEAMYYGKRKSRNIVFVAS